MIGGIAHDHAHASGCSFNAANHAGSGTSGASGRCCWNSSKIDKSWVANEPQSSTAATDRKSNERQRIEAALAQSNGKIAGATGAAAKLGIPASTLESKIRSLRINKFQFKGV
jgi:transcriptional regulator with GAF, ATPase, and Fis domain